ncbi:acetyltransferase EpsM [Salegentibacter echinorum]|uniref:Acetyltransferase EpsM n=1 Tax=Salegentibacter echinorum TaxID=1073325 RepID=A0A1M5FJL9_SALEC|nr:acetyltransferase [Salegentibacter echinorum]SHF91678.1 acetyltransferase EpsM [Salegentibacter echinorum]
MERTKINIYGASGHGKVIFDVLRSQDLEIHAIFDDNPEVKEFLNYTVIHKPKGDALRLPTVFAIGDNKIREKVTNKFQGIIADAVFHRSAVVSAISNLGEGTVIMPNAVVNAGTRIGKHCIVNSGAVVEHDVELGDFVHVAPNTAITGNVKIGEGTQIGAGASIVPGITIGKWVSIGAGAVIIKDIPDYAIVVGNPGKIIKYSNE